MKTHFVALSRTTAILTGAWRRQLFALVVVLPGLVASAQITDVGGIARDFTVVNRADGQPLHLYDLVDQVVVLDFFAYWCQPCQQSSPDVEQNIKQYYDMRRGNTHGVPVRVLPVNIENGDEWATDQFILNAGLDGVVNDYARSAYGQFDLGGIPLFVIISGVADSPSHSQWEVLYRLCRVPGGVHAPGGHRQRGGLGSDGAATDPPASFRPDATGG
jgi:thiol-disulfide isomerase/thioredoxin